MQNLDRLLQWYAALDRASLERIDEFYAARALFKDPFNDVKGVRSIRAIFAHMFATTEDPRFVILDRVGQGEQGFATWRFEFRLKGRFYTVLGATHFRFDEAGRVSEHRDYALAVPTPDHFIPLLYLAGIATASDEPIDPFVRGYALGSISMTCHGIGVGADCRKESGAGSIPDAVPADQSNI